MIVRQLLTYLGLMSPAIDALAKLDAKLAIHSQEARRIEARALARKVKMESDPNRGELRRIDAERRDTILRRYADDDNPAPASRQDTLDAFVRGKRT